AARGLGQSRGAAAGRARPGGRADCGKAAMRFVILEHDHPFLHWDLMLEAGGGLQTWRLAGTPEPGKSIAATALGDHRLMYLDYEGPVSGDRGTVKRWDAGTFDVEMATDDARVVVLHGGRVRGRIRLEKMDEEWRFVWLGET